MAVDVEVLGDEAHLQQRRTTVERQRSVGWSHCSRRMQQGKVRSTIQRGA
jgi:hypothetical protein